MSDATFTAPQVAETARVSYRRLDYWLREGFLASEVEADGVGSRRLFNPAQALNVIVFARLNRYGFRVGALARYSPQERAALLGLFEAADVKEPT